MSMFTLAISCLTTSNLPWFMDLTFQVPMQYCCLQHQILLLSPVTSTTGYCFCFGFISSLFLVLFLYSSLVAYWASTDLGSSSFSILSFCLFILFMGFSRFQWFAIPFSSGPHSVRPLHHDSPVLGGPTRHGLVSLSQTMLWSMWSDWLVFCEHGFSVSALWCPLVHLPSYLGLSHLGCGVSLHGCSSKVQPLLLTLDEGYLLMAAPPDLQHGVSPLGPPAPVEPLLLGLSI